METLQIVCPQCTQVNHIKNEVKQTSIACQECSTPLDDTTPIDCSDDACRVHIEKNDIPVLIDFYSPDCAPCMKMAPEYEEAARSSALEVRYIKVNTLESPEVARQYGVNTLPTIIAFKKGQEVNRFSSALPLKQLKMWAESLIQMEI